VTAGTAVDVAAYAVDDQVAVEIMDSTTVVFTWGNTSNNYRYAKAATVSGTVLTFGSEVEIGDTITMRDHKSVKLTSTTLMVGMVGNATSDLYSVILSLSGTTITDGTLNTYVKTTESIEAMILAEAGQVLVLIDENTDLIAFNIAYTGTTIDSVLDFDCYVTMGMSVIENSGLNSNRHNCMRMFGTDVVFAVFGSRTTHAAIRIGSASLDILSEWLQPDISPAKMIPVSYPKTTHLSAINSTTAFYIYDDRFKLNAFELDVTGSRFSPLIESRALMTTSVNTYGAFNYAHLGSRKFVMFYPDGVTGYPSVLVGSY
jgi:hypothetical protein